MQTSPDYYEGQLSQESQSHREALESLLEDLYEKLSDAKGMARLKLASRINVVEQQLSWQGANPKHLPFDELTEHVRAAHGADALEAKYRERIKNRATAIRAFCVQCQGGDTAGVRRCPSITCPLFPFRMGKDPLRGWDLPKAKFEPELPLDEEEDVAEFEDADEDDEDATE